MAQVSARGARARGVGTGIAVGVLAAAAALALAAAPALAGGSQAPEKPAPPPAPSLAEMLETWTELPAERTAYRRVFLAPDGKTRRGVVSLGRRWDPRTGADLSPDLRAEGDAFASEQAGIRIEAPRTAGAAPARLVLEDGEAVEASTRVRLLHVVKGLARSVEVARPVEGALVGGAAAWYAGIVPAADLLLESRIGGLETSLVLTAPPAGLAAGEPGAVLFEETYELPAGWTVRGIDAAEAAGAFPGAEAGGAEPGFSRIDQRLLLIDALGAVRATIEAPRVFEEGARKEERSRHAPAFAEVRFERGVLVYRVGAPAAWLADPARRFPVVFDPLVLAQDTPQTVTQDDTFTITPKAVFWNAVGVSAATDDFDIAIENANSNEFPPDCDFCLADGNQGPIAVTSGNINLFAASIGSGTAKHATPGSIRADVNAGFPWASTDILSIYEVNVSTASARAMVVDGVTGLSWAIFERQPGTSWIERSDAVAGPFAVGSTQQTVNFTTSGYWVLAVFRDGGPGSSGNLTILWPNAPTLNLARNAAVTASNATLPSGAAVNFTITNLKANFWNGVGLFGNDWDISSPASSARGGDTTDFIMADGNAGTISPTTGGMLHFSGNTDGVAEHAAPPDPPSILPGTPTTRPWAANDVLRVNEIFVSAAGSFTMTVSGVTNVTCALFDPRANADWISRSNAALEFPAGVATPVSFTAGYWALAVFRDSASAPVGTTLNIDWTGSAPIPVLTAISPQSVTAGASSFTLVATGSDFTNASVVRVDGTPMTTTFISSTSLEALIPASVVAAAGSRQVLVRTPGPGGGDSAARTLTVTPPPPNPAPVLASIAPTSAVAGSPAFTLTANGSGFISTSVVQVNGVTRTTTFQSAATLTAQILASDVAAVGSFLVTVVNPAPGGGTSIAQTFAVTAVPNPTPTLTSLSPSQVFAGSPGFTLAATGTNFVAGATVLWNGVARQTTFVSAMRVEAAIPDTDVASAGTALITVENPAPAGGTSGALTFTIQGGAAVPPTLASISPQSVTAGAAGFRMTLLGSDFGPGAVARRNGVDLPTTRISISELEATISAADVASPGSHAITVFDQVTQLSSGTLTFTVTPQPGGPPVPPTLSSISPSSVQAGSAGFTLTLNGSDFGPAAVARMNGVNLATTRISSAQLQATVDAKDIQVAGNRSITVFDATSSLTSGARTLSVTAAPGTGNVLQSSGGGGGGCAVSPAGGGAAPALPYLALVLGLLGARIRLRRDPS
jgi:hypothetical protein